MEIIFVEEHLRSDIVFTIVSSGLTLQQKFKMPLKTTPYKSTSENGSKNYF